MAAVQQQWLQSAAAESVCQLLSDRGDHSGLISCPNTYEKTYPGKNKIPFNVKYIKTNFVLFHLDIIICCTQLKIRYMGDSVRLYRFATYGDRGFGITF